MPEKFRKPESLQEFAREYGAWMARMNYAAPTIAGRSDYLLKFLEWCEDRGVVLLTQVTVALVERYPKHLYQDTSTKSGVRRSFGAQRNHLVAVREFFRWCYRQKHLSFNPGSDLELPRSERRLPRDVLSPQQVEQVMATVDLKQPEGLRDRAILETLYSTGIRRQELGRLCLYDVHPSQGTLMVRLGKGKKDRLIPIGTRALAWIEKYLSEGRPMLVKGHDPDTLFLTSEGEPCTTSNLSDWVGRYVKESGVAKRGACHMFRHAMATAMLNEGADLRFIQSMLGHAHLGTTEIYTHVSIQKLKDAHTAFHPGASVGRRKKKKPPKK